MVVFNWLALKVPGIQVIAPVEKLDNNGRTMMNEHVSLYLLLKMVIFQLAVLVLYMEGKYIYIYIRE